jgi:hypothetical protein
MIINFYKNGFKSNILYSFQKWQRFSFYLPCAGRQADLQREPRQGDRVRCKNLLWEKCLEKRNFDENWETRFRACGSVQQTFSPKKPFCVESKRVVSTPSAVRLACPSRYATAQNSFFFTKMWKKENSGKPIRNCFAHIS